jgi:hypothetical protein
MRFSNGFNSITIGRSDGGNMTIAGAMFNDPVLLQSGSAIAVNGAITGADNASVTLTAPTILNPNITTTDQDINLNGNVSLGSPLLSIQVPGQDNASITLQGPTVLNGNDNTITTTGSNITFEGTLNGTSDNGQNLTLSAGSGNITFNNAVGNTTPLGNLQVNSTGTTEFSNTVNAANLTTDVGGTTLLNGNVTTTGDQNYADTLLLQSAITTLTSNNGNVSLHGTVNSQTGATNDLTVSASNGNITFGSAVGNTTALGILQANSTRTTRFNSTVNATTVSTDAGGETQLNGNVTTAEEQNYGDSLLLDNCITLTSNNAAINFGRYC